VKIPATILEKFEQASSSLDYGSVTLTLYMKGGAPRYVIQKEESFIATDDVSVGLVIPYKEETEGPGVPMLKIKKKV
jgi:hypothetical protein